MAKKGINEGFTYIANKAYSIAKKRKEEKAKTKIIIPIIVNEVNTFY